MNVMDLMKNRRSIRKFKQEQLEDDIINKMLEAAIYAPTARNTQNRKLVVIKGAENIDKVTQILKKATAGGKTEKERKYVDFVGNQAYTVNYGAPLFIMATAKVGDNAASDCAVMLENMFLTAYAYGAGSVWVNQLNPVSDTPDMRSFLTKCGVPEDYAIYGAAAFGYPDESVTAKERKPGQFVIIDNLN